MCHRLASVDGCEGPDVSSRGKFGAEFWVMTILSFSRSTRLAE